ncbi:MAG: adenylate/guanylate cyclase domain-containing protein [Pseudomonadota bacterium]|nr:adenylate/guanylate cyclase domain-containing protein [Pseudomonadota bacterium]
MLEGFPEVRAASLTVKRRTSADLARTTRATVLFADLRGYTALAERLAPELIVPLLDEFFGVLAKATAAQGGTVFHMAGDGMMAGFGGPDPTHDGAREGLAAGHAMLQQFGRVASRWRDELGIETGIGVGLHLGDVAVGLLGPPQQKSMTLVGDTVNVAARLCSRARAGEVLLSCTVATALDVDRGERELYIGPIPVLHLPQFALRGRAAPLDIWCVPAMERAAI